MPKDGAIACCGGVEHRSVNRRGCPFSIVNQSYRNLFGPSKKTDRYQGYKSDDETREMLKQLADFMVKNGDREDADFSAGYTFLAQFTAHDLVHNPIRIPNIGNQLVPMQNLRDQRLVLETLYGGGPSARPELYNREYDTKHDGRSALRLMFVPDGDSGDETPAPDLKTGKHACKGAQRDLPRLVINDSPPNKTFRKFGDALLADPRNDENLIISQLTVIFALLHNLLDGFQRHYMPDQSPQQRFMMASGATIFIYRTIVFSDLLPKLLHPGVSAFFDAGNRLEPRITDPRVTVEFADAVFRAGQSMVRKSYVLNGDVQADLSALILSGTGQPDENLTHSGRWLIAWSNFFDIGAHAGAAQRAHKISTTIAEELLESDLCGDRNQLEKFGLLQADLLQGYFGQVRTVSSIARELKAAGVPSADRLDRKNWEGDLRAWLNGSVDGRPFNDKYLKEILENPPLLLFVMLEASCNKDGGAFGVLGSSIIAETFYRAREETKCYIEENKSVIDLVHSFFGGHLQSDVPETMPTLIETIARALNYDKLAKPFI